MLKNVGIEIRTLFNDLVSPRCRVFLITDQDMTDKIFDLLKLEIAHRKKIIGLFSMTGRGNPSDADMQNRAIAVRRWRDSDPKMAHRMAEMIGWDMSVDFWNRNENRFGYPFVPMAPSLTIRDKELYIILPRYDYYARHPDAGLATNPQLLENMKKWTPPAMLKEVPNHRPGRRPQGMPGASIPGNELRKLGITPDF